MATKGKRSVVGEQGVASKAVAQGSKPRTAAACRGWLKGAKQRGLVVPAYSRLGADELRALVVRLEGEALEPVAVEALGVGPCLPCSRPMPLLLTYRPAAEQVLPVAYVPWEGVLLPLYPPEQECLPVAVPACVPQPHAIPVSGSYPVALPVRRTPLAQRLVGMGLVVALVAAMLPVVGLLVALGLMGLGVAGVVALAVRLPGWVRLVARVSRRGLLDLRWWAHCAGHIHGGREVGRLVDVVSEVATAMV